VGVETENSTVVEGRVARIEAVGVVLFVQQQLAITGAHAPKPGSLFPMMSVHTFQMATRIEMPV
jgi:hypothetical protein